MTLSHLSEQGGWVLAPALNSSQSLGAPGRVTGMGAVMADVDTGDVLRIGATFTFEGVHEVTNVWHALVLSGGGVTYELASNDVADYMEDIYSPIVAVMSDEMNTDYLTLANVTQVTTLGAFAWDNPLVGAIGTERTPPGVCLFSWIRTLTPRVQIRKYFGVLGEIDLVEGVWSNTARNAVIAGMGVHSSSWGVGVNLVLQGVAYNRVLSTYTLPTTIATSAEPAYQRRRKRGRGS